MQVIRFLKEKYIDFLDRNGLIIPTCDPFILMYHRVIDSPDNELIPVQPGMYVTSRTFAMQMDYLKGNYNILPLSDLLDDYFSGNKLRKCCSLTFDDGWLDNYLNAFPILKDRNIPASFFLATSFIGSDKRFWSDELSCFLIHSASEKISNVLNHYDVPKKVKKIIFNNNIKYEVKITQLVRYLKEVDKGIRDRLLLEMAEHNTLIIGGKKTMMDWDLVIEMYDSNIFNFYPHTHNHELLTKLDIDAINFEISNSIQTLHHYIRGQDMDIFSYPSGRNNEQVKAHLVMNNVRYAVGTHRGTLKNINDPYEINRIGIHDDISCTLPLFMHILR